MYKNIIHKYSYLREINLHIKSMHPIDFRVHRYDYSDELRAKSTTQV